MNNEPYIIDYDYKENINTMPVVTNNTTSLICYVLITLSLMLITSGVTYSSVENKYNVKPKEIKEVYLDGYMYRIDNKLNVEVEDNNILIKNQEKNYRLTITPVKKDYNFYKTNLDIIKTAYTKNGYKVKELQTKIINEVEYLTMEMSKEGCNYLLSITRNTTSDSYIIVLETGSNLVDYTILEDISEIIKKSKTTISKRKIPSQENLFEINKVLTKS